MLTHVNYRSGRMHDMARDDARGARGGRAGRLGPGAFGRRGAGRPATARDADFAVGCGYKYLNGGPGAPAFVWAHPRHTARMDREQLRQPLSGWLGHAAPFEFAPRYRPGAGIARFVCGTPPVLSRWRRSSAASTSSLAAEAYGGMAALRAKSIALTDAVHRAGRGALRRPRPRARHAARRRASAAARSSFAHPTDGYASMQALIERGVIGDFRAPDIAALRLHAALHAFVDVWDAVDHLRRCCTPANGASRGLPCARRSREDPAATARPIP